MSSRKTRQTCDELQFVPPGPDLEDKASEEQFGRSIAMDRKDEQSLSVPCFREEAPCIFRGLAHVCGNGFHRIHVKLRSEIGLGTFRA